MRPLDRALAEQHAVVRDHANRISPQTREPGHQRGAVVRLELVQPAAVDEPGDHLAHVVRVLVVLRQDAADLLGRVERVLGGGEVEPDALDGVQVRHHVARDRQGVLLAVGEMVGDAGDPRVHLAAAELLGADLLAGGRLHQRRAGQVDRPGALDDDVLVRHRRHVGPAGRAHPENDGDLGYRRGRQDRLVVEDPSEVLRVGEDLRLQRQEDAARIDQVDARQAVVEGDLLRPDVLADGLGEIAPALDARIVGDHQALATADPPDAGDDPRGRRLAAVQSPRGERRQLEKRRVGIEELRDPLARRQLAALALGGGGRVGTSMTRGLQPSPQILGQVLVVARVRLESGGARIGLALQRVHRIRRLAPALILVKRTMVARRLL